jgi:rhodanese-related sulfurtransferase
MRQLTAAELANWLADSNRAPPLLLDVREDWELARCQIAGSLHMAMDRVPARMTELDDDAPIVCICHHGVRSLQVAAFLEHHGFSDVCNLNGGIEAWAQQVDPGMNRY